MARSQNGWSANDRSQTENRQVPGTNVSLRVRKGPAGDLLIYVAEQLDRRVESIDNGRGGVDDWGYAERPIRGGWELSNHASGTAIDLNAPRHPLGSRGTFSGEQFAEIHEILRECSGVVRWGGDYTGRRDEMHFEINAGAAAVAQAAARLATTGSTQEDDMYYTDGRIPEGFAFDKNGNEINPELKVMVVVPMGIDVKNGWWSVGLDGSPETSVRVRQAFNAYDEYWDVAEPSEVSPKWRREATSTQLAQSYGKISAGRMAYDDLDAKGNPVSERDKIAAKAALSYALAEPRK